MIKVPVKQNSSYSSSSYDGSSYTDSSSFSSSEGPDLLGNLSTLNLDLMNPLLNSYSISGGTTAGEESSYESSSYSTTESSSESEEPVKQPIKPVVQIPVKTKPVENNPVVVKKGFVIPDHEPTDEELAELEAKLKMNVKGNRFQKMVAAPTPSAKQTPVSTKQPTNQNNNPPNSATTSSPKQVTSKPTPPPKLDSQPNDTTTTTTNNNNTTNNNTSNNTGSSGWNRSNSTKRTDSNDKNSAERNKGSAERNKGSKERSFFSPRDKKAVFTDVDGGDTFSLFRRMNEIREEKREMNKQSEAKKPEIQDDDEPKESNLNQEQEYSDGTEPLIREFSVKEDMNKEGMKKAKKFSVTAGKGQPKFQMEDMNYCSYPHMKNKNLGIFCVFDGHAGKKCAETLTKLFPQTFYKKFQAGKWEEKTDLAPLLKEVYLEVDAGLTEYQYEGSTATTVIIWRCTKNNKRYIQSANLGDSTAFIVRNGKSSFLSEDHKLTIQSERQRIMNMGIALSPDQTRLCGLAVARAFGDAFPKSEKCGITAEPYVSPAIELMKTDTTLLLASDGLWDIVPDGQKAYDLIKNLKSATEAAKLLLRTAVPTKNNVCSDNVTVCVVSLI